MGGAVQGAEVRAGSALFVTAANAKTTVWREAVSMRISSTDGGLRVRRPSTTPCLLFPGSFDRGSSIVTLKEVLGWADLPPES